MIYNIISLNLSEYYSLICILSIITIYSNVIDNIYNYLIITILFTNFLYLYQLFLLGLLLLQLLFIINNIIITTFYCNVKYNIYY